MLLLIALFLLLFARCSDGETDRFLVMAAASGYSDPNIFRTFLASLREIAQYKGDVALFVLADHPPWPDEIAMIVQRFNVKLIKIEPSDRISRHGARVARYVTNVRACAPHYRACFAVDFRDLFFQSDPFVDIETHLPTGVDLMLTAEDKSHLLSKDSSTRAGWRRVGADHSYVRSAINLRCAAVLFWVRRVAFSSCATAWPPRSP